MKLAVILPTKGMMFSKTAEELLDNLEGYDYDIFFARGTTPDAINKSLQEALCGSYMHFWFVGEDMILPKDTLERLLEAKASAITCDYPVSKEGKSAVRQVNGNAIWCGIGCLLVTRAASKSSKVIVKVADFTVGKRKLIALGKAGQNNGEHDIELWTEVVADMVDITDQQTQNVTLKDGTVTLMQSERAKKLAKEGKLIIPKNYTQIIGLK